MTSQVISSSLSNCPLSPVRSKWSVATHLTTLVARSQTAHPPKSHPQALWVACLEGEGVLPLCRGAVSIFDSPSQQGGDTHTQSNCIIYKGSLPSLIISPPPHSFPFKWHQSCYRSTKSQKCDTRTSSSLDWLDQLVKFDVCAPPYVLRPETDSETLLHTKQVTLSVPEEIPVCIDCLSWDFQWLTYPASENKIQPCLTSPSIHVLTIITCVSLPKLIYDVCMLDKFPLKIGTTIVHMDSQFSPPPPQCQLDPVVRIYFYIHKVGFLGNTYTSYKALCTT